MRYVLYVNGFKRGCYDSLASLADDVPMHAVLAHDIQVEDTYLNIFYKVLPAITGPGIRLEKID